MINPVVTRWSMRLEGTASILYHVSCVQSTCQLNNFSDLPNRVDSLDILIISLILRVFPEKSHLVPLASGDP